MPSSASEPVSWWSRLTQGLVPFIVSYVAVIGFLLAIGHQRDVRNMLIFSVLVGCFQLARRLAGRKKIEKGGASPHR